MASRRSTPKPRPGAAAPEPLPLDPLITVTAAAAVLGVTRRTVERWMAARTIPFVRLGPGTIRFRAKALERFITKHEQRAL